MDEPDVALEQDVFLPRAYQLEMLEASMKENIIVAMDTGSGKTPIAVMRIAAELERSPDHKRVWFICPKVALAQQQCRVVQKQLPGVICRVFVGEDGCEYWATQQVWNEALFNVQVVVCTPGILKDALTHGFVKMASISLLIVDEAHHCKDKHLTNRIMSDFYHPARLQGQEVPHILGLTASPTYGNDTRGLQIIEQNMNAICKTPRLNREELRRHTHWPELIQQSYPKTAQPVPSILTQLQGLFSLENIHDDPWVKQLKATGEKSSAEIQSVILRGKTNFREQMQTLINSAVRIHQELGPWACERYVLLCVEHFQNKQLDITFYLDSIDHAERRHILELFSKLDTAREYPSASPEVSNVTSKVSSLIQILLAELHRECENPSTESFPRLEMTGIVFVQTRSAVVMLKRLLEAHSHVKDGLKLGVSFGTSSNANRKRMIADCLLVDNSIEDIDVVLDDLRTRKKNLLISTNVVEEGIDITACNSVICFDQPPDLVSFVQRRGRARDAMSRYYIMFPKDKVGTGVPKWLKLEEELKAKYMDDLRELERLEKLERSQGEWREHVVESTGAKLTQQDAVSHLHHFCSILGSVNYASSKPLFSFHSSPDGEMVNAHVMLPSFLDSSLRKFHSSKFWVSEQLAKADAAFEACLGLHEAGLLNDHFLPVKNQTEEEELMYQVIEKRPNVVAAAPEYDPWQSLANVDVETTPIFERLLLITQNDKQVLTMKVIMPGLCMDIESFRLYADHGTELLLSFGIAKPVEASILKIAHYFTHRILFSVMPSKMQPGEEMLPVLFLPTCDVDAHWLVGDAFATSAIEIVSGMVSSEDIGLIKACDGTINIFHGIQAVPGQAPSSLEIMIEAQRMSKRTDFLHPATKEAKIAKMVYLNPSECKVDNLPSRFTRFATFIPCIQHKIRNSMLVETLTRTLLASAGIKSPLLILEAVSAPAARQGIDYQRMEFLGDALFKYYTTTTLMAQHPNWPEGYLAYTKDLIVSNKAAALATKETGLDQFIIRKSFTGHKWRPIYLDDLHKQSCIDDSQEATEISTKLLADVVEALLGAAYLDDTSNESGLLAMLNIFTCAASKKKITWRPLPELLHVLQANAPHIQQRPAWFSQVEDIVNHQFELPGLAIEALTHPSYMSLSSFTSNDIQSYQRLEFLGDAVLDNIVTRFIHASDRNISVFRMHLLRTAAVNQDILGYLALRIGIYVETSELVDKQILLPQKRGHDSNMRGISGKLPQRTYRKVTLPQLLRHSHSAQLAADLAAMQRRCDELDDELQYAMHSGDEYPWTLLATLAPEKLVSDLFEAMLGAIFIDSNGNLDICQAFLERAGILPWLRRALNENVKVWHPKEELGVLADTKKVDYQMNNDALQNGLFICTVVIDGQEVSSGAGPTRRLAEMKAAECAIKTTGGKRDAMSNLSKTQM